jgi:hypothetical protein
MPKANTWGKVRAVLINSAFWTALATVVIAGFTVALYYVSKHQWQTMQNTLDYQVEQTRARLAITNVAVHDFPSKPYLTFCLENGGHTMADQIRLSLMRSAGAVGGQEPFGPPNQEAPPGLHLQLTVGAVREGVQDCHYVMPVSQFNNEKPTFDEIAAGVPHTGLWIEVFAEYEDTATKKIDTATNCVCWESWFKQFMPCFNPK